MAKIVVCASGEGSNFEAIVRASREGTLRAEVVGLVANRSGIGALARAESLSIPAAVIRLKDFTSRADWDLAMLRQIREWRAEWIALAGFLAMIGPELLKAYPQRIVNSHPALLPKFGGDGMYGDRVHAAVLKAGEAETGITVHTIDAEYDRGQILAQRRVVVEKADTPTKLARRVKSQEVLFYPKVLNDLVTGRIKPG